MVGKNIAMFNFKQHSVFNDPISFLACALAHKEDGNYHFQRKEYRKAIAAYTEGLKQKQDDESLKAILLTNRAAANFHLGKLL